jgi:uncharacterized protein
MSIILETFNSLPIAPPKKRLEAFCRRWKVRELSLFGSILTSDFRPDSDVDVLLSFSPDAPWSLFDMPALTDELKLLFGRDVDVMEKEALRNPFRRRHILANRRILYAA